MPLVLLTLKFGQINLREAVDRQLAETSRPGATGWLWYARQFPAELGWPLLVTACLWPAGLNWRICGSHAPRRHRIGHVRETREQ